MRRTLALLALLVFSTAQPASAQSRAARTEDLFALRELGSSRPYLAVSPNGGSIAILERTIDVSRNRYDHRIMVVDLQSGSTRHLADAGDIILASIDGVRSGAPLDRRPAWSADGNWIYYIAEVEGRAEIWRTAANGGGSAPVVQTAGDVRRFVVSADALIFEAATSREDLAESRQAAERSGFRVDDRFKPLASMRPTPDEETGAAIWRLSLTNGTTVVGQEDERSMLAAASVRSEYIRPIDSTSRAVRPPLGLFASTTGERCSAPECSGRLEDAWRLDGGDIVFLRREGHALSNTAVYRWRPGAEGARQLRVADDRLAGCTAVRHAIYCVQDFAAQPGRVVAIDTATGALRVVYEPNPQWHEVRLPRIERLEYVDTDGNESFAQLVYPEGYRRGRRYPLVIVQYRALGFLNAGTGREAPIFPLAAQGHFVLSVDRPEFRLRESHTPARQLERDIELDGSESRSKREANLHYIAELNDRGLIDMQRLAITGMSDGAQTLFDMLTNTPLFAAAVAGSPPNDPILWSLQSSEFRLSRAGTTGLDAPWDTNSDWHTWWYENTPAEHAEVIRTPLLLNVPEAEALRAFPLLARLEQTNTPIETWIYPDAYHLKWRPAQIQASQDRTMDWLNFWLLGVAPQNDRDPGRAERWRALRHRQQDPAP